MIMYLKRYEYDMLLLLLLLLQSSWDSLALDSSLVMIKREQEQRRQLH